MVRRKAGPGKQIWFINDIEPWIQRPNPVHMMGFQISGDYDAHRAR
jgi:hypothetical protein